LTAPEAQRWGPAAVARAFLDKEPAHILHVSTGQRRNKEIPMNAIIYLVGLVVVVMFVLSLIGLR
jgi:hypothetical protein